MTNTLQLTPRELVERLENGELWRILDVREAWELEIAALAGTLNIPLGEVPARYDELPADAAIAVLCHSGVRSNRVAHWLVANGRADVANIAGGIDAWSADIDDNVPRY
jgi:rhodanese-related sulfurtransferase